MSAVVRRSWVLYFGAVMLTAAAMLAAYSVALRFYMNELGLRGERLIEPISATLQNELERVAALPGALIQFDEIAQVARGGDMDELNALLARVAYESGVRDVFVLDFVGVGVASSNWQAAQSVIGLYFGFHPFHFRALLAGKGSYHALGAATQERGFYFSRSFRSRRSDERFVLVARIAASDVEAAWRQGPVLALVDPNGVIFMSSEPRLIYRTVAPLDPATAELLARSRQYDRQPLAPLPAAAIEEIDGWPVLRLAHPGWAASGLEAGEVMVIDKPLASGTAGLEGFTVRVLLDTADARAGAFISAIAAGLGMGFVLSIAIAAIRRRRMMWARLRREAEAKQELERRVAERTSELTESNHRLQHEIEERRAAAAALQEAEAELAHAQQLAALGRLSANVSHEVNQPLAAIRAYAENAEAFLGRGQTEPASGNLARITAMADRIKQIITNLRLFARGDAPPPRPARLFCAWEGALEIMEPRLAEVDADAIRLGDGWDAVVMVGETRLQQVFANLLANAADALEAAPERKIMATAQLGPLEVLVKIHDTGPGLAPEMLDRAFDPFVTNKSVGDGPGLGLGLSIVYGVVKGAGGSISARNHPAGGAEFALRLLKAEGAAVGEVSEVEA